MTTFIGRIWMDEGQLRGSIEFVREPGQREVRCFFGDLDQMRALIEEELKR